MHKYICTKCDNLLCETSICPVCNGRTELNSTEVFYCKKCNTPLFDNTCSICGSNCDKVGTDLRPVFAEERLLLEVLIDKPFCFADKSVWCVGANNYIIDGIKKRFNFVELRKKDPLKVIELLKKCAEKNQQYVNNDFDNIHIKNLVL